ncbi:MAG TPA: hypothetical protein VN715_10025 [Roseiarcus sp.]|nr:hypothetical protein [Roseiarcus sp.]
MGLRSAMASVFGRGDDGALSVPPMDGVFKPNNRLETAERVVEIAAIDNLTVAAGALYGSSGDALMRIDPKGGAAAIVRRFDGEITMLTASQSGRIAVGVQGAGLALLDGAKQAQVFDLPADCRSCITAGLFRDEDNLALAIGSRRHSWSEWKWDLMSHGATGAVANARVSTGAFEITSGNLAFPYGLAVGDDDCLFVSESWRHRIVSLPTSGTIPRPVLSELPAYPARIVAACDGGYWLAFFAPRRQLTEFVLQEDDYRREMMETIPPESWIGPDFADGSSEEQPLQAGSVRQMGIMKPWAPSRSYGLVVHLDRSMAPTASYHSRADGSTHGVASIVEWGGQLYAASRGAGALIRLGLSASAST